MLKLTYPTVFVAAEDVARGKPDPQGYYLGRKHLELGDSKLILVLEDAPSRVKAGKAARFKILAAQISHLPDVLQDVKPDWIVQDLRSIAVKGVDNDRHVQIEIMNALQ